MTYDNIYALGMYFAMMIVLLAIVYAVRKKSGFTCKYDERQKIIQGQGYKYGFFVIMISCMAYGIVIGDYDLPIHPAVGITACVFLGIGVFIGYCIWKDAYFGIKGNNRKMIILMVLMVILNVLSVVSHIMAGTLIEDGVIGISAMNALGALLFLAILIVIAAKKCGLSKADDRSKEEDE